MALIRRVSRLFAADMHAVLDQLEEPEAVLRQAIREMEEELARQQQRQKWLSTEIESVSAKVAGFEEMIRELDAKLDICFANDNEALAKKVTRRKLETAKLAEHARTARDALSRQLEEIDTLLETNSDRLECMRQKAAVLAIDESGSAGLSDRPIAGVDDDDVEIAYLREKQARASS
jgi:phage shock protein A